MRTITLHVEARGNGEFVYVPRVPSNTKLILWYDESGDLKFKVENLEAR
jgi:hypothetical protein